MNYLSKLFFVAVIILLSACSTQPIAHEGVPTIQTTDYENLVSSKTMKMESYDGLANKLNVSATKLDTEMSNAILARSAQIYEWNTTTFQEEKTKSNSNLQSKTNYFLSFYTPERNNNNLSATKSIWKIYLDVNGQRYEGKTNKLKSQIADIQSLYPHHTRFSSAYLVEFPVATSATESQAETLTITGPNASVKMKF